MDNIIKAEISSQLLRFLSKAAPKTVNEFRNLRKSDLELCHFGLGLYIRNNILTATSKLHELFILNDIYDKDDMSAIVVSEWHDELNETKTAPPFEWQS